MSGVAFATVLSSLALAGPASATFSWDNCGGQALQWNQLAVTPDPITGSGAALPFRWEVTYNPATNAILHSEFDIGAPQGTASEIPLLLQYPDPGNVLGSATFSQTPAGLPVPAGGYSTPAAGVTADGVTAVWSLGLSEALTSANLQSVTVTIEKKVFGVFVEIPGVSNQNTDDIGWLTPGDYYMRTVLSGPSNELGCVEMFFTLGQGGTAPIVLRPATGSTLAATVVSDSTGVGPGTALLEKAKTIQAAVDTEDTASACEDIGDYLGLVHAQAGKKLTTSQANQLTSEATNLSGALDCGRS